MIRPFTCVCMLLAGGSGLYLYQSKHRAQLLDREIGRVLKQTEVARDRIGVLRAEWAVLNEPERLAELSQQHLGLRQLSPTQFVAVADLGTRLPPAMAPGAVFTPADEPVVAASVAPPPPAPRAPPIQAPRAAAPVPAAPPPAAVARAPASTPAPAPPRPAPRPAAEAPVQVAAPAPAPLRAVPPVMNVAATPLAPMAPVPRPMLPGSIGESVLRTSALGGARAALPPPTPYGTP